MADLDRALEALHAGDVSALDRTLRDDPGLVHARVRSAEGHYCGYFHQATLLHHVAGNPLIRSLSPSTVELTRVILDRGADVDAATAAGPRQPHDLGWSTLGLVATSAEAARTGHQRPLIELLLGRGADLDFRGGGPLVGALYYGEMNAARFLVERGARVNLVAASGLGRLDLMQRFVGAGGALAPDAHSLVHYSQVRERPASRDEILGLALIFAGMGGHTDAVAWLLDLGAAVNGRPPFDHHATALHWAGLRGHRDIVSLFLERGADRTLRDTTYDATPQGWAEHNGHHDLASLLAT